MRKTPKTSKTSPEYVLPEIPERGTRAFREYAARVMSHEGGILAWVRGADHMLESVTPGAAVWDWNRYNYAIDSSCPPKATRRWYTLQEFMEMVAAWPSNFLVNGPDGILTANIAISDGSGYMSTQTYSDVASHNFEQYKYSLDGGKTWVPVGVDESLNGTP